MPRRGFSSLSHHLLHTDWCAELGRDTSWGTWGPCVRGESVSGMSIGSWESSCGRKGAASRLRFVKHTQTRARVSMPSLSAIMVGKDPSTPSCAQRRSQRQPCATQSPVETGLVPGEQTWTVQEPQECNCESPIPPVGGELRVAWCPLPISSKVHVGSALTSPESSKGLTRACSLDRPRRGACTAIGHSRPEA